MTAVSSMSSGCTQGWKRSWSYPTYSKFSLLCSLLGCWWYKTGGKNQVLLLIPYCGIPLYFHFSVILSITDPLRCTTLMWHPVWHAQAFMPDVHPQLYLCYWTSFTYKMDRWPIIIPFLSMSCTISFHFCLIASILYYMTVLVSYPMCPVVGWLVTSHCAAWSGDLLLFCCRWALCSNFWLSFIFKSLVFTIEKK